MADQRNPYDTPAPSDTIQPGARDWHPLASSNLDAFQYDPRDRVLRIRFKSGREYSYENVSQDIVAGLESAPSAGRYFNEIIKPLG